MKTQMCADGKNELGLVQHGACRGSMTCRKNGRVQHVAERLKVESSLFRYCRVSGLDAAGVPSGGRRIRNATRSYRNYNSGREGVGGEKLSPRCWESRMPNCEEDDPPQKWLQGDRRDTHKISPTCPCWPPSNFFSAFNVSVVSLCPSPSFSFRMARALLNRSRASPWFP